MKKTCHKIGLFGGTFDPIHVGHLIIADTVREKKNLDIIVFIPSAHPPHKGSDILFNADERLELLKLAVENDPSFVVSDIEMHRQGPSYTIDTLLEIKKQYASDSEISFILGKDNIYEIETWKNPYEIVKECKLLVADRICDKCHDIPDWLTSSIEFVDVPLIEISSSTIRQRIIEGKSIRYLVPESVAAKIENMNIT